MKILFLVYHGFSPSSGISKKIHYQVEGLRQSGHDVRLCYYDFDSRGHRCRMVDGAVIQDYGCGRWAALRQRTDYDCVYRYCASQDIRMVYARSFQNASPWLIGLFRRLARLGIHSVTEIPTYPYDQEFRGYPLQDRLLLKVDQLFRRRLAQQMDGIVTFSDCTTIFGQLCINISNGVDFAATPMVVPRQHDDTSVHLIGVAEVHYWHGYDRLIAGLGLYYRQYGASARRVVFHLVGKVDERGMKAEGRSVPSFSELIDAYGLHDVVVFHGQLFGRELDDVFNQCDFAVGSLARHRSGITRIKTLKNREYATRGLPFVYSETDADFDSQPYVLKVPADETPVDIRRILDFYDSRPWNPEDIRRSVEHLSWKSQMKKVVDAVFG